MINLLKKTEQDAIGLIGHLIIDYPNKQLARAAVKVMVEAGVDLIELQIPFSEPIADGPVFMQANHQAIKQGVHLKDCFEFMQEVTELYQIPFVFTAYANSLAHLGFENFVKTAVKVGAKGAIVPDLPIDYAKEYLQASQTYHFAPIQLIPINCTEMRMAHIAKSAGGFIYAVARSGVSGDQTAFSQEISGFLTKIRRVSDLPIAVGFGVKTKADIAFLKPIADYAIVGTQAFLILQNQGIEALAAFWQDLARAAKMKS